MPQIHTRESNMECLRIFAMICIILCHIVAHGMTNAQGNGTGMEAIILGWGGVIGNNLFILISGYFSIYSTFKWEKVIKLVVEVTFYSVLLYCLSVCIGTTEFSINFFIKSFVPFLSGGGYWFFVTYLMLYFAMPLINKGIEGISRKQFQIIIVYFFFLYCVVARMFSKVISINDFGYTRFMWMILVYCVGAYLRKYMQPRLERKSIIAWLGILLSIRLFFTGLEAHGGLTGQSLLIKLSNICIRIFAEDKQNSILPFAISLLLFFAFKSMQITSPFVAKLGGTTFGVYLIHDNMYFRDFIWHKMFRIPEIQGKWYFVLAALIISFVVFGLSSFADHIRQKFLERPLTGSEWFKCFVDQMENMMA